MNDFRSSYQPASPRPWTRHGDLLRFVNAWQSVLIVVWTICTFGYKFPKRRVGENLTVCIFRTIVILITRLSCIMGAVWYLYTWISYLKQGDERPFNILEREAIHKDGTLTPVLNLYSLQGNRTNVTQVRLMRFDGPFETHAWFESSYDLTLEGDEMMVLDTNTPTLVDENFEYVEIVLKHGRVLPEYPWYKVNLVHPNTTSTHFTSKDLSNQYYYQPGHYVEIRYTPLRFYYEPKADTLFGKFKSFLGFGEEAVDYSYVSSVTHIPFPAGQTAYDALTTVIILRPQSIVETITYREEKTTFRDSMSSIGGLVGLVGSVIVFLFGVELMSPWGFIAGIPFFRKKISGSLAKAYDSPEGFSKGPFTTEIDEIGRFDPGVDHSNELKIKLLKERIDELELVLREYFLDGEVFQHYADERNKLKLARKATLIRPSETAEATMRRRRKGVDNGSKQELITADLDYVEDEGDEEQGGRVGPPKTSFFSRRPRSASKETLYQPQAQASNDVYPMGTFSSPTSPLSLASPYGSPSPVGGVTDLSDNEHMRQRLLQDHHQISTPSPYDYRPLSTQTPSPGPGPIPHSPVEAGPPLFPPRPSKQEIVPLTLTSGTLHSGSQATPDYNPATAVTRSTATATGGGTAVGGDLTTSNIHARTSISAATFPQTINRVTLPGTGGGGLDGPGGDAGFP